jgi:prolyl-tRNA editing enzyme YbaK/EbsC (Cys-tRNA(Pro) deacylase)
LEAVTEMHPNCVAIDRILAAAGLPGRVKILPDAAPTALSAAAQIGCDVGAIANSLVFTTAEDGPLLILTSGAHRVNTDRVAALVGTSGLTRARPEFVKQHTGQVIGGVAPLGHPAPLPTLIDTDLARWPEIWAAGGIAHSVFPIGYDELRTLTSARAVSVE